MGSKVSAYNIPALCPHVVSYGRLIFLTACVGSRVNGRISDFHIRRDDFFSVFSGKV